MASLSQGLTTGKSGQQAIESNVRSDDCLNQFEPLTDSHLHSETIECFDEHVGFSNHSYMNSFSGSHYTRHRGGGKGGPPSSNPDQNIHADGPLVFRPYASREHSPVRNPADDTIAVIGPTSLSALASANPPSLTSGPSDMNVSMSDLTSPEELEEAERRRIDQEELVDNETNFWRWRNFTIPLFYFVLGFALRYPTVALREFMRKDLHVSPAIQSLALGVVMYIPFSLKIFFAFLSDGVPILGQRRKPYMIFGIIMAAAAWITLGFLSPAPSVHVTSMLLFTATFGIVWCDTMVDTLVVERMRHEHGANVGKMQTTCWMLRYGGMFIGILMGGWLLHYGSVHPQSIFTSLGFVILIVLLPAMLPLADEGMRNEDGTMMEPPEFMDNLGRIWEAVQLNSIWMPMIFVYIWNVLPNDGDAWVNYLLGPLKFTDEEYSYILAIGTVSGALGAFLYRSCLRNTPLHPIFYITIIISAILSCIPFILIFRVNRDWGMPDFAFAMGNEVINDVAGFIMYMPVLIMCSKLCPDRVEGSVYALTCVVNNIGSQISMNFSSMTTNEFGITLTNFDRLWELHLLVVCLMFIPLGFVWLTPNNPGDGNPDEMRRMVEFTKTRLMSRRARRAKLAATRAANGEEPSSNGSEVNRETVRLLDQNDSDEEQEEDGTERSRLTQRHNTESGANGDADVSADTDRLNTTADSASDATATPTEAEKKSTCCTCGDEVEIDEADVSEEDWKVQEKELEDKLNDLIARSSNAVQSSSAYGGGGFLIVIFASLLWSTSHAAWRISKM